MTGYQMSNDMTQAETRRSATLWMGDLEPYMDDNFLVHAFKEAMGKQMNVVREIKIPLNKMTCLPMGYCFVEFIDYNTAFQALHQLGGKLIPNSNPTKRFKLNTVGSPQERLTEYSVWVGDLDPMVDDEALFRHFAAKYNSTTAAKVVCDKTTGLSRGFAFVRFSDETEQQRSMIELNNTELLGRHIKIRSAQPRMNYNKQPHQQQTYGDMTYHNTMAQANWYATPDMKSHIAGPMIGDGEDPEAPVEPVLLDEVTEINKDFVNMSGDVYDALESCRWLGAIHPVKVSDTFCTSFV
ncbi:tRNA selenocysteine 1-associated protein 1-like [Watersipora subatra]|uniref:tRNA selenocysteine 1-associated protein 1-like n=1 Tax=Watersipora subatra TaxID=2589382 RepID=UPI00355C0194